MESRDEADEVVLELTGYEDLTELAAGGFGVVYRARQIELDRTVAIKVLTAGLDARSRSRFERECRTMARLSGHPHIVVIHDAGISRGRAYIVMEYVGAGSLADRLDRDGPLPWREAADIGAKLAAALAVAHRGGILHRDIKPENILVSDFGEPKLGDFGIAQAADMTKTQSGTVTATVAHAAPEVLGGQAASEASDVYSLASTVHALIAGRPAFVRDSDESFLPVISRVATEPVPDLRPRGVPGPVCAVLEQAMAKDPVVRPTASAFADRLRDAIAAADRGETVDREVSPPEPRDVTRERPSPTTPLAQPAPKRRRARLVAAVIGSVALVVGVVGFLALAGGGSSGRSDDAPTSTSDAAGTRATQAEPAVVATIDAEGGPTDVAAEQGAIWVANIDGNSVSRIDPSTNTIVATVGVGAEPEGVAVGEGGVWVPDFGADTVSRIDPATNTVVATIGAGSLPIGIAAGEGAVWVANFADDVISRIDPATNSVVATIGVGVGPEDLATGAGAVWVANGDDNTVSRIDPATNSVVATIPVDAYPADVAVGEGAVWVANSEGNVVSRIDPATNTVVASVPIPAHLDGVAAGDGAVWVASADENELYRIDPATNAVTATIKVPGEPSSVAVGAGATWAANLGDNTVARVE